MSEQAKKSENWRKTKPLDKVYTKASLKWIVVLSGITINDMEMSYLLILKIHFFDYKKTVSYVSHSSYNAFRKWEFQNISLSPYTVIQKYIATVCIEQGKTD